MDDGAAVHGRWNGNGCAGMARCPLLQYGLDPPYLPNYCNSCNATFSICHALDCNRGGLVTAFQNDLRDGFMDLAGKAFTPSHVFNHPLVFEGCAVKRPEENPSWYKATTVPAATSLLEATENKSDLLIRDLWQNGTDSVQKMCIVDTGAKSHSAKTPEKCLHEAEQTKNNIYLEACLQKHQHFSPFVASVNRLLGVEAIATMKRVASRLATMWRKPYSRTYVCVNSRVAITLVRATHWCIRGPGCRRKKIVSRTSKGNTAPGSTSSGKRAEIY